MTSSSKQQQVFSHGIVIEAMSQQPRVGEIVMTAKLID